MNSSKYWWASSMKKKSSDSMANWVPSTCITKTSTQDGSCSTSAYFWNTLMPRSISFCRTIRFSIAFCSSSAIWRSSSASSAATRTSSSISYWTLAVSSEMSSSGKQRE